MIAVLAAALALETAVSGSEPPAVRTVAGASSAALAEGLAVALFWRADCGPCLAEFADLRALRQAATPLRVTPVLLDPPARLAPALAHLKLDPADTLVAREGGAAVLTRLAGAPPRLPLAVAFDAAGRVCGRRTGFLGYVHLRAWARACVSGHAPRS